MPTSDETALPAGEGVTSTERARRAPLGANYRKVFAASVISNLGDGVSTIAYPWLASAVTRNPVLVALIAVAQRLPWLGFTLIAGVITDRVDRRRAMVLMDVLRGVVTVLVALAVLAQRSDLPAPDRLDEVVQTRWLLYGAVVVATLLLGMAEVLRDNSAQTIIPSIVEPEHLERANGRMWSAEGVANTFVGPPLGSLLIAVSFALPFVVDAASFFAAAGLVFALRGSFRAERPDGHVQQAWTTELREGFGWLWRHPLLRPMAIILGLMNMAGMVSSGTFVLFAQEVLHIGAGLFAVVMMGGAVGGIVGGTIASALSKRFGSGACLAVVLLVSALTAFGMAATRWWPVAFVLFALMTMFGLLWNVITVSLRQTIIPPHLLGRVNSVYRFFAWGMMPIGAAMGGVLVALFDSFTSRSFALRMTWVANGVIHVGLFVAGRAKLTTVKIEAARAQGIAQRGVQAAARPT